MAAEIAARHAIAVSARSERARLANVTDDSTRTAPTGDRLDVQVSLSVSTVDAVTVRKGLTAVTKPSREVAWRGPARFAARIHETLVDLHQLVVRDPGCVSLAEHAICASTRRWVSSVRPIPTWMPCAKRFADFTSMPAAPCRPSRSALAARLVELAEKTEHAWLQDTPERYRDAARR